MKKQSYFKGSVHSEPYVKCGTTDLDAVYQASKDFKAGRPLEEGINVDEVEITVYDEWDNCGLYLDGGVALQSPVFKVDGDEMAQRMFSEDDIEGFTPVRGHEYRIRIRRFYLDYHPWMNHHYELLEVISDTLAKHTPNEAKHECTLWKSVK